MIFLLYKPASISYIHFIIVYYILQIDIFDYFISLPTDIKQYYVAKPYLYEERMSVPIFLVIQEWWLSLTTSLTHYYMI